METEPFFDIEKIGTSMVSDSTFFLFFFLSMFHHENYGPVTWAAKSPIFRENSGSTPTQDNGGK